MARLARRGLKDKQAQFVTKTPSPHKLVGSGPWMAWPQGTKGLKCRTALLFLRVKWGEGRDPCNFQRQGGFRRPGHSSRSIMGAGKRCRGRGSEGGGGKKGLSWLF